MPKTLEEGGEVDQVVAALKEAPYEGEVVVRMGFDCYQAICVAARPTYERAYQAQGKPLPDAFNESSWLSGFVHPVTKENVCFHIVVDGSLAVRDFEVVSL